jgi:F0F1-type ATP synthase membrane subunit b/b'
MLRYLPLFLCAVVTMAQPHGAAEHGAHAGDPYIFYKWVNFGLLAIGLAFLMAKTLPGFFRDRNAEIAGELETARKAKMDADARTAAVEAKLKNLDAELLRMKQEAQTELSNETKRTQEQTSDLLARMEAQAGAEVSAFAQQNRQELKQFAGKLALELAEKKLSAAMNNDAQAALVARFGQSLQGGTK